MRLGFILLVILFAQVSVTSAVDEDTQAEFDDLTTKIRQTCRYSPMAIEALAERAEALLDEDPSFESELRLMLAKAPARAMAKGYAQTLEEVFQPLVEVVDSPEKEELVPLIRIAAADLAARYGDPVFGFSQFLEGVEWIGPTTRGSTRLMLLEQGINNSLLMCKPEMAAELLEEFEDLGGYLAEEYLPIGLILKARVKFAMGDLKGMNETLEDLELKPGILFRENVLKRFWILKANYAMRKGQLDVAERFLLEAGKMDTALFSSCLDALVFWNFAVLEDRKGSDEEVIRQWLEKAEAGYKASGRPGNLRVLLTSLVQRAESFASQSIHPVFHEFLASQTYDKNNLFAEASVLHSKALLESMDGNAVEAFELMHSSREATVALMDELDLFKTAWLLQKVNLRRGKDDGDGVANYYFLLLLLLFTLLMFVLILRIRTQNQINLRLKQSVETSRLAEEAAEHANKLKSQFVSNISHEIKTPMSGLVGMASILDELVTDPVQRTYLDTIRVCSRNLLVLMNDLLDLGRIESGRLEIEKSPFNPDEIFSYCEQLAQGNARAKGLSLKFDIDQSIPDLVIGDSTRFGQVLINLLNNAIKFTDSGLVSLSAKFEEDRSECGMMIISVSDTGRGIESKRLNTVFEPFNQDEKGPGMPEDGNGLGLAICKSLIDLMEGSIMVVSEVGKGSTFTVSIPFLEHFENPEYA
jgi:signal transduction histidine kinase